MAILNYKCPFCTAPLSFDSKVQKVVCKSCDNEFNNEDVKSANSIMQELEEEAKIDWKSIKFEEKEEIEGMEGYRCSSCSAEILGDANSVTTECLYCGNHTLIQEKVSGIFKPDYIIPFKKDKNAAKEALQKFYKGKILLPNDFKSDNRIEKISGVYVPFWLFDCNADVNMVYDATKVRTWSDSNNDYEETSHYMVQRAGNMDFSKIPVDGSNKMADEYMDAIEPFNYDDMIKFDTPYLAGYLTDKFDVDVEQSIPRANERVENSCKEVIRSTIIGYDTLNPKSANIRLNNGEINYAMLPVWVLNTKYEGKIYTFAMNGQTGKLVGQLPVDKKKFWTLFLGIFFGLVILAQIFVFMR